MLRAKHPEPLNSQRRRCQSKTQIIVKSDLKRLRLLLQASNGQSAASASDMPRATLMRLHASVLLRAWCCRARAGTRLGRRGCGGRDESGGEADSEAGAEGERGHDNRGYELALVQRHNRLEELLEGFLDLTESAHGLGHRVARVVCIRAPDESFESLDAARALKLVHFAFVEEDERGEAPHVEAAAQAAVLRHVHVANANTRPLCCELVGQLVPSRSHLLAVATPGSVKLDEPAARRLRVQFRGGIEACLG
mmetsp:Transcript_24543/g.72214  ORF Transcript_24543/g.72214 Transcript_24543/m.72214 type:complete len:252 (+) Transcript_24543:330-1085(+)